MAAEQGNQKYNSGSSQISEQLSLTTASPMQTHTNGVGIGGFNGPAEEGRQYNSLGGLKWTEPVCAHHAMD